MKREWVTNPQRLTHFQNNVTMIASTMLHEWVGDDRAQEAVGRVANAISSAAAAARDPSDFYACTPDSIARVAATAALIGIMPSTGKAALAYAIPQRPRRDAPLQLDYMLSHRGLIALAKRAGLHVTAVAMGHDDELNVSETGSVVVISRDLDNPPADWGELRGVLLVVRDHATGAVLVSEFMPKKLIAARRKLSRSGDRGPWGAWPVEMAVKTAIHYGIARGWVAIDDTEAIRALSVDSAVDQSPLRVDVSQRAPNVRQLPTGAIPQALAIPQTAEHDGGSDA